MKETHEQFIDRLEEIRKRNMVSYRGYIIEPSTSYFGGFDYYPESEGRNDDAELVGDPPEYSYCGNVRHAQTLEDAKDDIWERVMMATPQHKVVLNGRDYFFSWIDEAMKFAIQWNAEEFVPGVNA